MKESLYFVAYLPDEPVAQQVWAYKREVAGQCGSVYGLKVLPHVTFINPFHWLESREQEMAGKLSSLISSFAAEELIFNGFGCFKGEKSNTIYITVERSTLMEEQHAQLSIHARNKLHMSVTLTGKSFTTHMTIAYRDLKEQEFACAWPLFEHRPFNASGRLDRLWLLKHNGARWETLQEFIFQGVANTLF